MDAVAKKSGGQNIVGRPQARAPWYSAATVDAQEVEIFVQEIDPVTRAFMGAPQSKGRFSAEGKVVITHTPDSDRDVIVYAMPYAADNTPGYSDIRHAEQATVLFRRETDAPAVGITKPATAEEVEVGITGFTRFARYRRVTVSANADMSDPLAVLTYDSSAYAARELPRYLTLTRTAGALTTEGGSELQAEDGSTLTTESDAAVLPLTVYVTVAHSSGAAWTPESEILQVTFAAVGETGGSGGDFDPTPRDKESLDPVL